MDRKGEIVLYHVSVYYNTIIRMQHGKGCVCTLSSKPTF